MRQFYTFLFFLFALTCFGQTTVFQESFEGAALYTTSMPEQTDGAFDYFTVTDGSNVAGVYNSPDGSNFFAAQDLDADGMMSPATMTFDDLNISSFTDLTLAILLAEDDDGANNDWDSTDFLHIEYDIDNSGTFTNLLWVENDGSTFNSAPYIDSDFDGVGDGAEITESFAEFAASITGSGSLIDIRITFGGLTSSDEDIALDNIRIIDGFIPTPTLIVVDGPASESTIDLGPEDLSGDLEFATTNFTVGEPGTPSQGDGYIVWSLVEQGVGLHDSGTVYDTSLTYPFLDFSPNVTYLFSSELLNNSGGSLSPNPVTYNLTINTLGYNTVTDIEALRTDVTSNGTGLYYEITGAVLVTHTDGFQNRHWIQDSNISGILIYDSNDYIVPSYTVGDFVTGLKGSTEEVNGVLRFNPSTNSGIVSSSGNPVVPQVVTIPTYTGNYEDYESELIELQNVSFVEGNGVTTFATGTNYTVSDGANTVVKRTDFFGADYIGSIIPSTTLSSLVAVTGEFNTTPQVYVRSISDLTLSGDSFETTAFGMYPNPNGTGTLTISTTLAMVDVAIYDILGKEVLKRNDVQGSIDISILNSGLYIVKLSSGSQSVTKKLVVQ